MVLCDLHSQAPKWRTKGKNSLVLQKSIIFAANIFAIAAKNIGFFGATVLDVLGELLLAIPNKLRYHLPTHASEGIAKWQKRILSNGYDIGARTTKLLLLNYSDRVKPKKVSP